MTTYNRTKPLPKVPPPYTPGGRPLQAKAVGPKPPVVPAPFRSHSTPTQAANGPVSGVAGLAFTNGQRGPALRSKIVQRFTIEFNNLSKAVNEKAEVSGIAPGSKLPHYTHTITSGAHSSTYNIDDWTNKKGENKAAGTTSLSKIHSESAKLFAGRAEHKRLKKAIAAWNCVTTIFESLLQEFVFEREPGAKWYAPEDITSPNVSLHIKESMSGSRALVAHLVTLRASMHWRERTILALSIESPQITFTVGSSSVTDNIKLDWGKLLKACRELVKQKLQNGIAPPPRPPSEAASGAIVDSLIYDAITNCGSGFAQMKTKEIIYQSHGAGFDIKIEGAARFMGGSKKRGDLIAGFNHIRFAIWTEWLAVHELRTR